MFSALKKNRYFIHVPTDNFLAKYLKLNEGKNHFSHCDNPINMDDSLPIPEIRRN